MVWPLAFSLSVFIELDAWACRPLRSDFKIGHADSGTGGAWNCFCFLFFLKKFLRHGDLVYSHLSQP